MSDLPPGYSDFPPGSSGPPRPRDPFDPGYPPPGGDPEAVKGRVRAPAIFLIIVGALNLIIALYQLYGGAMLLSKTPAEVHQESVEVSKAIVDALIKDPDMAKKVMDQAENADPKAQYNQALMTNFCTGAVWGILSLITLIGAVRMLGLRGYGLAMTGAVIAAIPVVSCCCVLGQIAGIWAIVVLMNSEVRSAFR
jgi:hypothetical protein